MRKADPQLLTLIGEPQARQHTARVHDLPSGTIPVLAAVAFFASQWGNCRSNDIQALKIASPTLVRRYVADLIQRKLLERIPQGRSRLIRLTSDGQRAVDSYQRAMRTARRLLRQDSRLY